MTLRFLNSHSSLNCDNSVVKPQQSPSLSKPRGLHHFHMANVPNQPDDDPTPKDAFDPTAIRPTPAIHPTSNPPRPSSAFPHVQLSQQSSVTAAAAAAAAAAHLPHPAIPQQPTSLAQPSPIAPQVQYATPVDPRPREHLNSYDLFPEINVPSIVATPQDPSTQFPIDPKAPHLQHQLQHQQQQQPHQSPAPYDSRKHPDPPFYTTLPLAAASSRVTKRTSRPDLHEHSSSPSIQSPSQRAVGGAQSSLERRKAHRAYTQKSRNKVNSRFEALLDALPTPPPRLNPRSKAEILEYATETVIRLVSQNNKLELHLALSSSPQLEAWLTDQTQNARTVREVCQPIKRLFTIGLEWKGAEVWAIDSRAPMTTASLGQAWTFVPPPSGRRPSREEEARMTELTSFLDSGKGTYYTTTSNEALAVVYRTGKPAWLSCEYKAQVGFDDQEYTTERTRLGQSYGISDVLFVPLILYNHVQIVVNFYNMKSRSPSGNPTLQPQIDPKSSIKVATEAINIIARRFCSLPGVSEFAEQ